MASAELGTVALRPIRQCHPRGPSSRPRHHRGRSAPWRYGLRRGRGHRQCIAAGHDRHHVHRCDVYDRDRDHDGNYPDDADDHSDDLANDDRSHDDERQCCGTAEETAANHLDLDLGPQHDDGPDNCDPDDDSKEGEEDAGQAGRGPRRRELSQLPGLGNRWLRGRRGADPLGARRVPLHAHATLVPTVRERLSSKQATIAP